MAMPWKDWVGRLTVYGVLPHHAFTVMAGRVPATNSGTIPRRSARLANPNRDRALTAYGVLPRDSGRASNHRPVHPVIPVRVTGTKAGTTARPDAA